MAQPFIANCRFVLPYTTVGLTHKLIAYVNNLTNVGGTWKVNRRTDTTTPTMLVDTAIQGLWDSISYMLPSATTVGIVAAEKLISSQWQIQHTFQPTGGNGAGTYNPATQFTATLREDNYAKMKLVLMEVLAAAPIDWDAMPTATSAIKSMLTEYTVNAVGSGAPWIWQVGRSSHNLADNPFVHAGITLNRKLRRARGYV